MYGAALQLESNDPFREQRSRREAVTGGATNQPGTIPEIEIKPVE
jgi:hypothetical protein